MKEEMHWTTALAGVGVLVLVLLWFSELAEKAEDATLAAQEQLMDNPTPEQQARLEEAARLLER